MNAAESAGVLLLLVLALHYFAWADSFYVEVDVWYVHCGRY